MLTESIIGMTRLRWKAKRPFEGHTKESFQHKLRSTPVRDVVKEQLRQELALRERDPIST